MHELDPNEVKVLIADVVISPDKGGQWYLLETDIGIFMIIQRVEQGEAMCSNCKSVEVKAMIVAGDNEMYVVAHCDACGKMIMSPISVNDEDLTEEVRMFKHMKFSPLPGPSDN